MLGLTILKSYKYKEVYDKVREQYALFEQDVYPNDEVVATQQIMHHITANNINESGNKILGKSGKKTKKSKEGGKPNRIRDTIIVENVGGGQHHQSVKVVQGTDGHAMRSMLCYLCQEKWHYAEECPMCILIDKMKKQSSGKGTVCKSLMAPNAKDSQVGTSHECNNSQTGRQKKIVYRWGCGQAELL
mmetsp:Transcript_15799/g.22478  ORF Transcript_15799/g.22478 Transcript_15799/m.22478 type:complete len:188 (-) Transcript_15799:476-1039(-)